MRIFHIGMRETGRLFERNFVSSSTACCPPSSSMTSLTVLSCFPICAGIITIRDKVKSHRRRLDVVPVVLQASSMSTEQNYRYSEQGRRLRLLREAERYNTGTAFAAWLRWPQSGYSQFETGFRRVPIEKVLELVSKIPGFDPKWLWHGDKRGLSFDLRQRIEEQELKEDQVPDSARSEG